MLKFKNLLGGAASLVLIAGMTGQAFAQAVPPYVDALGNRVNGIPVICQNIVTGQAESCAGSGGGAISATLLAGTASIGSINNSAFGISGLLPAFATVPTFNIGTFTGMATEAKQDTGNVSLANIATNTNKIPALGQAVAANSTPVVLPAAQITALLPPSAITGFNLETTQLAIKSKTDNIDVFSSTRASESTLSALNTKVITTANGLKVDNSGVTQPISATALPLPTGASTDTKQDIGNASLAAIAANTNKIPALGQAARAASSPVTIANDQTAIPTSAIDGGIATIGATTDPAATNDTSPTTVMGALKRLNMLTSSSVTPTSPKGTPTNAMITTQDGNSKKSYGTFTAANATGVVLTTSSTGEIGTLISVTDALPFGYACLDITSITAGDSLVIQTGKLFSTARMWNSTSGNQTSSITTTANGGVYCTSIGVDGLRVYKTGTGTGTVFDLVLSKYPPLFQPPSSQATSLIPAASVTDINALTITTTTASSNITPTIGNVQSVEINVTAMTGTSPQNVFCASQSLPDGTGSNVNFPCVTITGVGKYLLPDFISSASSFTYLETVTGTTPSITRTVTRSQKTGTMVETQNAKSNVGADANITCQTTPTLISNPDTTKKTRILVSQSTVTDIYWDYVSTVTASQTGTNKKIKPDNSWVLDKYAGALYCIATTPTSLLLHQY